MRYYTPVFQADGKTMADLDWRARTTWKNRGPARYTREVAHNIAARFNRKMNRSGIVACVVGWTPK